MRAGALALCAAVALVSVQGWRAPALHAQRQRGPKPWAQNARARANAAARHGGARASAAPEPPAPSRHAASVLRADLRDVLLLALPALGTCLLPPLAALVDAWALGRLTPGGGARASAALAALEANSALFGFAEGSFAFVAVAMTRVLGAQASAGDLAQARAARAGICLSLCAGGCAALGLVLRRDALLGRTFGLAGVPELLGPARRYLCVRALALPAAVASCAAGGACVALRAVPKRAYGLALCCHVLLAASLVTLGAGVRGVACAKAVSCWVQLLLLLLHVRARLPAVAELRWLPALPTGPLGRRRAPQAGSGAAAAPIAAAAAGPGGGGQLRAWVSVSGAACAAASSAPSGAPPPSALPKSLPLTRAIAAARPRQHAPLRPAGAALGAQLLSSAAWASAGRAASRCGHVPSAAAYQLLGEGCSLLACAATPLSLAAQGLLPAALAAADRGRARRLLALTLALAGGVGCAGGACALLLGRAAPALLCADPAVRALLRTTAPLGGLTVLCSAINQGLYGGFVGLGWLRPFLAMNAGGALFGLGLLARLPAGCGPEGLLAVWRCVAAFSALKTLLGLAQLPALLRGPTLSPPPPSGAAPPGSAMDGVSGPPR